MAAQYLHLLPSLRISWELARGTQLLSCAHLKAVCAATLGTAPTLAFSMSLDDSSFSHGLRGVSFLHIVFKAVKKRVPQCSVLTRKDSPTNKRDNSSLEIAGLSKQVVWALSLPACVTLGFLRV